jgi:hypothetical protein
MKTYFCRTSWITRIFLLLTAAGILAGCVGNYGNIRSNTALLDQYKNAALPDNLNYYYCGRSSIPYAVVGIDNTYTFSDRFWFKIEAKQEVYKKIANLSELHRGSTRLFTSDILGPQGQKLGIWFSFYSYSPVVLDNETRMVDVYNPYKPNEDRWGF